MLVLKETPAFSADVAERTGMSLDTAKNALTDLHKRGVAEYTGEVEPHTKAREVRLTEEERAVMGITNT